MNLHRTPFEDANFISACNVLIDAEHVEARILACDGDMVMAFIFADNALVTCGCLPSRKCANNWALQCVHNMAHYCPEPLDFIPGTPPIWPSDFAQALQVIDLSDVAHGD